MDVRERFKGRVASALLMVLIAGWHWWAVGDGGGQTRRGGPPKPHHHGTHRVGVTLREFGVIPAAPSAPAGQVTFQAENIGPKDPHELVVIKTDLDPNALLTTKEGGVDEKGAGSRSSVRSRIQGRQDRDQDPRPAAGQLRAHLQPRREGGGPDRGALQARDARALHCSVAQPKPTRRPAGDAGRGRPPQAAARRAGLEDVVESSYGHGSAWLVGSPLIAQLPAITRH